MAHRPPTALLDLGYLIDYFSSLHKVHKSTQTLSIFRFFYEKTLFGPVYLSDQLPAANESSKHSPAYLRPSHLGGQQSSTCLSLSFWKFLLA